MIRLSTPEAGQSGLEDIRPLTEADFDSLVLRSQMPAAVMVTLRHSKLCAASLRELMSAAKGLTHKIKFFQVDADAEKGLTLALRVKAVPSLLVFVTGMEELALLGFYSKEELDTALRRVIPTEADT